MKIIKNFFNKLIKSEKIDPNNFKNPFEGKPIDVELSFIIDEIQVKQFMDILNHHKNQMNKDNLKFIRITITAYKNIEKLNISFNQCDE